MGIRAHLVKTQNTTYIDEAFFTNEGDCFEWLAAVWGLHPSCESYWQVEYCREDVKDALDYYHENKDTKYSEWKAMYEHFGFQRPFADFLRDVVRFLKIALKETQTDYIHVEWF